MTLKYNVTGPERKKLVQTIAQSHGCASRYLAAPTFAYQVGAFHISRDGAVSFDGGEDDRELTVLAFALAEHGFTPEEMPPIPQAETPQEAVEAAQAETPQEAAVAPVMAISATEALTVGETEEAPKMAAQAETDGFCVELPRAGVTQAALDNLRKLVDSKAALIRKALGADRLDIDATDEWITFPWFDAAPEAETASAAARFIGRLVDMARTQKRVTAKEKPVENERYAFRCFLLRLGFIGAEYKADRKALLHNLTGSAAFKNGDPRGRNTP